VNLLILVSIVGLGFIWIGYPLGVALLAAMRPARVHDQERDDGPVSIILATNDEAPAVRARVANLLASSYPADRIEVVVALDAARARTSIAELSTGMDPRVRVVAGDQPGGKASTLNAAVRAARHDTLVFTDTAQTFDRNAVTELARALRDPKIGAVSGILDLPIRSTGPTLADRYWRYERWIRNAEARLYSAVGVTGAIYATRRAEWAPLPAGLILDDVYVPMRLALAGWRIGFTDRARAFDGRRFSAAQERQRKIRTLTGVIQLCVWLPNVLNPMRNPLWVQFTCHKLLRLLTPYLAALGLVGGLWKLGAMIVSSGVGMEAIPVLALAVLALLIPRVRRGLATQLAWGYALQSSIIVATVNGMRGRWDVWQS